MRGISRGRGKMIGFIMMIIVERSNKSRVVVMEIDDGDTVCI